MNTNSYQNVQVTIVIPAHNEEKTIEKCIEAIQAQKTAIPYRILVVDNASTDQTSQKAAAYNVDVIHEAKKGLFYARQKGLDETQTEFIVYIDADTYISDTWLTNVLTYFHKHSDAAAISSNFHYYDASLLFSIMLFFCQLTVTPLSILLLRIWSKPDFFVGCAFAVRTEKLKQLGGFSKDFMFYGEDIALSYKLATGGKVRYLQTVFVNTSARRFNRLGTVKTWIIYAIPFFYFVLGKKDKAIMFSKKYSE